MHQLMAATLDTGRGRDPSDPVRRPQRGRNRSAALADDRPEDAQGLDRSQGGRRPARRGDVPRPPGAPLRAAEHPEHLKLLEDWLRSYRPEELFDESGRLKPELAELAPEGERRMGANPHANGGVLLRDLRMPDFRDYAIDVPAPGEVDGRGHRARSASSSAT